MHAKVEVIQNHKNQHVRSITQGLGIAESETVNYGR
jgi:hypothetical protein